MKVGQNKQAFTIVELLVVIVIIGILAAITIVSYSGVQNAAIGSNLQSDLASDAKLLKMYSVEYGHYPSSLDTNNCPLTPEPDDRYCLKAMNGAKLSYVGGGQAFTLFDKHTATGITYKISEGGSPAISVLPASYINLYGTGSDVTIASAVDITSDDGYIVSGKRGSLNMSSFSKFGPDNSISWVKYWNFSQNATISAIKKTSDGGLVITGTVPGGLAFGVNDLFIAKFSSTNQLSWMKLWGTSDNDYANDIIQTSDGGYAVTGLAYGNILISRFLNDGTLSWTKTYGAGTGYSIIQTSDSGFAVAGYISTGGIAFKTDVNGALSWSKTWKNSSVTVSGEYGQDIIQTSDGGYAVAGTMTVSAGKLKSSILKLAQDGTYQWHNYLEVTNNISLKKIVQSYDGGYALAGTLVDAAKTTTKSDVGLAKISSSGELLWSRNYGATGDSESGSDLALTADGGYLVVGDDWIGGTGSIYKMIVMKYKNDGTMNNCSSPTCKSGLVYSGGNNMTFADSSLTATLQSYTTVDKTYTMADASLTQTVIAAP